VQAYIILAVFIWGHANAQTAQPGSKNKKGVFYFALRFSPHFLYTQYHTRHQTSDPYFDLKLMKVKGR
jgi:hypothetical protein